MRRVLFCIVSVVKGGVRSQKTYNSFLAVQGATIEGELCRGCCGRCGSLLSIKLLIAEYCLCHLLLKTISHI